jgi:hypothetical protein
MFGMRIAHGPSVAKIYSLEDDLPTADFLFIWYTYLVHPRIYFEDNVG